MLKLTLDLPAQFARKLMDAMTTFKIPSGLAKQIPVRRDSGHTIAFHKTFMTCEGDSFNIAFLFRLP